jgi:hypothetical protein
MRFRVGAGWGGVGRRGGQNINESRQMFPPWAAMYTGWGGAGAAEGGQQKYLDAGGRAADAPHFSEFYFKNNVMAVLFCPGTEKRDLIYLIKYKDL